MSRFGSTFLFLIFLFAATPFVNASITEDWWCTDDGDGAIVMDNDLTSLTETAPGEYDLSTTCVQERYPGHIIGEFPLDTPGDPIVWFINEITNETDFDWTDYQVAIGMAQEFSILTTGLMMPNGWYADITPAADDLPLPGDEYHGDGWVGYIDYYQDSGDPVLIDDPPLSALKYHSAKASHFVRRWFRRLNQRLLRCSDSVRFPC